MYSHTKEVAAYHERTRKRARIFSWVYLVVTPAYLLWRLTTFDPHALVVSCLFYLSEVYGFLVGLVTIYTSWNYRVRPRPVAEKSYTVDVLLPVYTEPLEMIELTLIGAKEIDYPHETWLLDDGKRDELKELAARHGVHYLRREGNANAKAGNMNHALEHCRGELIAVFDADHIPQREALDRLIPHMNDAAVAMVQAPQFFYNENSFLCRDSYVAGARWHEECYFMDRVQGRHDEYDACTSIGTGMLLRRSHLDAVGGFARETITEDLHTSLRMHKRGLKTVYIGDPVAWGVAAADVEEYNRTRQRWSHGNLHAIMLENALFCRGLPWRKRLPYIAQALYNQEGWQQFFLLLVPILSLAFYMPPFKINLINSSVIVGMPVIQILLGLLIGGSYLRYFSMQVFLAGKMVPQMMAAQGLFGVRMRWRTSFKNAFGHVSIGLLVPHIIAMLVCVIGWVFIILQLKYPSNAVIGGPEGKILLVLSSLPLLCAFGRSWLWVAGAIRRTGSLHEEYLFETQLPVLDEEGQWLGVSRQTGTKSAELRGLRGEVLNHAQPMRLLVPGFTIHVQEGKLTADGAHDFTCRSPEDVDRLRRSLYSVDWHRRLRLAKHSSECARQGLSGDWMPACIRQRDGVSWAMMLHGEQGWRLVTTESHAVGDSIAVEHLERDGVCRKHWMILEEVHPDEPMPRGLNDQVFYFFKVDTSSENT